MTTNPTVPPEALPQPRTRGRPPIKCDNRRVQGFARSFLSAQDLCDNHPPIDDVFAGVVHLQTQGEGHTRPLSRRKLFRVLQGCSVIDAGSVARALPDSGASTVARYAAAARVSAGAIARLLDVNPGWTVSADRHALDAPYHAELHAAGLL